MALTNPQRRGQLIGPPPPRPPTAGQQTQPTQPAQQTQTVGQPPAQPAVQPQTPARQTPTGSGIGTALMQTSQTPTTNMQAPPPPPTANGFTAPQLNQYGTYATPEQIAESLAAGETPFDMTGYQAPTPTTMTGQQTHYIGNTGQTMSQAEYDKMIASGGWYTPPDELLGPEQWGPDGSMLPPPGTIEITPEMIAENRAYWESVYGQNQGGPASAEQIAAAPHTPPGTTFPNIGNPAIEAPWMGGPEPEYGPGTGVPDSYGYVGDEDPYRIEEDPFSDVIDPGTGGFGGDPIFDTGHPPRSSSGLPPLALPPETQTGAPPLGESAPLSDVPDAPDIDQPEFDVEFETDDPMDIFNQGADALEARLERSREQSARRIREEMSQRGVVADSPEWGALADLEGELNVQRKEGLSSLAREQQQFGLQNRAQELQKYGIDSELAYSYAALEQDSGFRQTALELQSRGMDMDEAYRYSAMAQDGRFRQLALDLQSRGLDMDEAYRQAALQWEKERFGTEVGLQEQGLGLERDRFRAWIQQMLYDQGIEAEDVPDWLMELMGGRAGEAPPDPDGDGLGDDGMVDVDWDNSDRDELTRRLIEGLFGKKR